MGVELERGREPRVSAGIRDLRVLKTTQSSFTNFVMDEFSSLKEDEDRLFSTVVKADWSYSPGTYNSLDFDAAFSKVRQVILHNFAGPADIGVLSPSVQETQFKIEKSVLEQIPQVSEITISMPNAHYFDFDFSKFFALAGALSQSG